MRKTWLRRWSGIVLLYLVFLSLPHIQQEAAWGIDNFMSVVTLLIVLSVCAAVGLEYGKFLGIIAGIAFASVGIFGTPHPDIGASGTIVLGIVSLLAVMGGEELRYQWNDDTHPAYVVYFYGFPLVAMLFALLAWMASSATWLIALFVTFGLLTPLFMAMVGPPPKTCCKKGTSETV